MPDLRIGDDERRRVIALLERHVGDGRLDLAEFADRSGRVTAARTRSDLDAVQADLPRLPDPVAPQRARRAALAATWGSWALTSVICLVIWSAVALGGGGAYFWPIWVIGPWGALLAIGTLAGGRLPLPPCAAAQRSG
ncbi:DUF1707 domain-containing protein [Pseudonocardia nematodicida]|uniref:DUF1707 domain-containing protein n=1 Tax=Pseudonocardia nematodicida TaxID=1206997 RepID=A0ABV1KC89_9PSEU